MNIHTQGTFSVIVKIGRQIDSIVVFLFECNG